jgi:predicted O-linked N-acetylglucosamine transferase (SPINDLY family)
VLRRLLADVLIASGSRAERRGRLDTASRRYRAATTLAPGHAPGYLNLGAVLEASNNADAAYRAYESALAADASNPYARYNVGRLSFSRGDIGRAERLLREALALRPDFPEALVMIAYVLDACQKHSEAAVHLEASLKLNGGLPGPWYNYGEALSKLQRYDEAEKALHRALELDPRSVPAWHCLGSVLRSTSHLGEALEALARARQLEPDRFDLESLELLILTLSDQLSAEALLERHRAFGRRLEASVPARTAPYAQSREPGRRLRVGYVSCDFYRHPVSWFLLPLLERHDRTGFESILYNTGDKVDEVTGQVKAAADGWREVQAMSDEALAQAIERDAIDVLVDLTGHTGALRLGVFARQPAPVQVSWLGYLHSTGLTRIGYRLTDARADPPGASERLHTETLVRLPHCLWCYRPPHAAAHAAEAPWQRNGFITFGSFNHAPKLTATSRRIWAEILLQLPQARLLLVGVPDGRAREDLLHDFAAAGVPAARLTIRPRVSFGEYLEQFDAVDIALDTTPYGGGTTSFDALWMGVPVLTLVGERSVSRSAASILGALGLEKWIARSAEEYLSLALAHAADPERIAALRGSLRRRLQSSSLMDEARFARDMESAYRELWRAWCGQRVT